MTIKINDIHPGMDMMGFIVSNTSDSFQIEKA